MNVGKLLFKAIAGNGLGTVDATNSNNDIAQIGIGTRLVSGNSILFRNGAQVASSASDATVLAMPTQFGIGNHQNPSAGGQFV